MTWMDILKSSRKAGYWVSTAILFAATCYGAYEFFPNQMQGDWNAAERSLTRVAEWNSFQIEEHVSGDDENLVHLKGEIKQDPPAAHFGVKILLRQDQYFSFEGFRERNRFYLRNQEEGNWIQMDLQHPTAGELNAMTDPMNFWKLLLTKAKKVERNLEEGHVKYRIALRPFSENAHGITFKGEGEEAAMEVWTQRETGQVERISLEAQAVSRLHDYQTLKYVTQFSGVNQTIIPQAPKEALHAKLVE